MSAVVITAVAVLGILLTVAGVIGVWLAMRTAQHTQTVKNFRDAAESWREKAEALDSDLAGMRTEMTELRQQYTSLLQKYEALQDVVTSRTAIENLGVQIGEAQSAIIAEIRQNRDLLHALSAAS